MVKAFRELIAYRALIQVLVARDLKARYRGSILGLLWTLLNPLLHMGIYVLLFAVYMQAVMENYAAFLLCGLLPWIWFSSSLLMGATSIIDGGGILKRVPFPVQVFPMVTVIANFMNFVLSIPLLVALLLLYSVPFGASVLVLPLIVACQFAFTLGLTFVVSAISVRYRDVPLILSHLLTFWFFLSPIIYSVTQVPERFWAVVSFNPFAPFVVAYQHILFYNTLPSLGAWGKMCFIGAGALLCGVLVFNHFRWSFAEEI